MNESTSQNLFIGYLVMGLSQLLSLAVMYRKFSGKSETRTIADQPLKVRGDAPDHERFAALNHQHAEYIKHGECEAHHVKDEARQEKQIIDIKGLIGKMEHALENHNRHAEERANELHSRITALIEPMGQLKGRFNDHVNDKSKHKGV